MLADEEEAINFLPESPGILLKGMLVGTDTMLKISSIEKALMQATRPRVLLTPLLIGLEAQLHHHFASRLLVDILHKLGFC